MNPRIWAVALAGTALLAGCSSGRTGGTNAPLATTPAVNADELVQDMVKKMQDVKSGSFRIPLVIAVSDKEKGETMNIKLDLEGKTDATNDDAKKSSLDVEGSATGTVDGQKIDVSFDLSTIVLAADLYAKLNALKLPAEFEQQFGAMIAPYKGQWWIFKDAVKDVEDQASGSFADAFIAGAKEDGTELTAEQEAELRDLMNRTKFFNATIQNGTLAKVGLVDTYKVDVTLNKAEIVRFAQEAGKITGDEPTAAEISEMEDALGQADFRGTLSIGAEDHLLYGVKGSIVPGAKFEDAATADFKVDIDATMADFGKPVELSAPAGAKEFDMSMFGGAAPETSGIDAE